MSRLVLATARPGAGTSLTPRRGVARSVVVRRRLIGLLLVVVPVAWAWHRATPGDSALVNRGGLRLLDDLLATAAHPSLDPDFLLIVLDGALVTLVFAVLGTAGALVVGLAGGLVLSDAAWSRRPPAPVRALRSALRGVLVAARSIHELVWALLLVSVLGLDPLVAVLAIAVPFGAQTAKVFADTLDGVSSGPLDALRGAGARPASALAYALVPEATPLLLAYSFYRLECAIRSAVLLGVIGVGGLGQELTVSLQSRNWNEVWTLVGAVVLLSALVELWSARVRADLDVFSCSDWSAGAEDNGPRSVGSARWSRWSALAVLPAVGVAWWASDVSLTSLTSPRTRALTGRLLDDLWPPELPRGGWSALLGASADTVAMAVLAMAVAVVITLLLGPGATRLRRDETATLAPGAARPSGTLLRLTRWTLAHGVRLVSRAALLVLRSVPPTVWAIVALLALFPGVLPGALALGLYTGGILGRLVAEAWESLDLRPRNALRDAGVGRTLAAVAAVSPPSAHQLLTYTLYRFEICVRDTAVVGVVGAAGLGRLLAENLSAFRFPVITSLLAASFAVSLATEVLGRRLRRALRA